MAGLEKWRQKFLKLTLSKAPQATPRSCLKLFTSRGENPIDLHSASVCSYKARCFSASPVTVRNFSLFYMQQLPNSGAKRSGPFE